MPALEMNGNGQGLFSAVSQRSLCRGYVGLPRVLSHMQATGQVNQHISPLGLTTNEDMNDRAVATGGGCVASLLDCPPLPLNPPKLPSFSWGLHTVCIHPKLPSFFWGGGGRRQGENGWGGFFLG